MSKGNGLAWFVGVIVVGGVIVRTTLFDVWHLPDDPTLNAAVQPTLGAGDVVLVSKRGHGGFADLVRCADPDDATKFVIGRVAGTPHDTVVTQDSYLAVNNTKYISQSGCPMGTFTIENPREGGDPIELHCGVVEMGGHTHLRGTGGRKSKDPKVERTVPDEVYFLVSDDRDLHDDSRDYGFVTISTCKTIAFRLWSKNGWGDSEHRLTYIR